jgi:predicted branched-subunit amino acid permease
MLPGGQEIERQEFRKAYRSSAPTMLGIFAWGVVAGIAMIKAGLTLWQALGMTLLVFAGSAQLAVLPLIATNVPLLVIFFTSVLVNLRFVIFAVAVSPHFAHLPWYKRAWYGYFNADIMMAFFPQRFPPHTVNQRAGKVGFFSGIAYPNWVSWQAGSIAGILLAGRIPPSWGIEFAGSLAVLAVLIPLVVNSAVLAGVTVSGVVAVAAAGLPYRLGLLLAVVLGMVAAMVIDTVIDKKSDGSQR